MFSLTALQIELSDNILEIKKIFIQKYLPATPEHTPDVYQHDVKAYCILAHAIFEEFVETLSLEVMNHSTNEWLTKRSLSAALIALCLFYNSKLSIEEDEDKDQPRSFDALRESIDEAKRAHSLTIYNNHGFSLKYLRTILSPVAVDVTSNPKFTNSLRVLADARGSYAHKSAKSALFVDRAKASRPMTPEKARDIVEDCLELCAALSKEASKYLPAEPEAVVNA